MCIFTGAVTVLALATTAKAVLDSVDHARILGTPDITCSTKWVTLSFKTSIPFQGRVFVEDMAFDSRCSAQYTSNLAFNATFRFPMRPCTRIDNSGNNGNSLMFAANIKITFHPIFILQNSRVLRIACADSDVNGRLETEENANSICKHVVSRTRNQNEITVGDYVYHKWSCLPKFDVANYAVILRRCDVVSKSREVVHIVDPNGCVVDELLMGSLNYATNRLEITAHSKMFRFIDSLQFKFTCNIALIPRSARHAHVTLPKCGISREELRRRLAQNADSNVNTIYFERGDQLYRDFSSIINGSAIIETQTTTEWFFVRDNPTTGQANRAWVVSGKIDKNINNDQISLDKQEHQDVLKRFMPNQHPYGRSNLSRIAKLPDYQTPEPFPDPNDTNFNLNEEPIEQLIVFTKPVETTTMIPTITTTSTTTTTTRSTFPSPKQIIGELDRLENSQNSLIKDNFNVERDYDSINDNEQGNFEFHNINRIDIQVNDENDITSDSVMLADVSEHKADWRLDDVILNKTEELVINCASEFTNSNKTQTMLIQPSSLSCTWRSLNVALLLWSLGSVIIWIVLFTIKLYYRVTLKFVSPSQQQSLAMPRPHFTSTWYPQPICDYSQQHTSRIGSNFLVSSEQR